jgi:hypothetical protein
MGKIRWQWGEMGKMGAKWQGAKWAKPLHVNVHVACSDLKYNAGRVFPHHTELSGEISCVANVFLHI